MSELHANGARTIKENSMNRCAATDIEIGSVSNGVEVCTGRIPAPAFECGSIKFTETLLLKAIHILCDGVASFLYGLKESIEQGVVTCRRFEVKWAAFTSVFAPSNQPVFEALKVR